MDQPSRTVSHAAPSRPVASLFAVALAAFMALPGGGWAQRPWARVGIQDPFPSDSSMVFLLKERVEQGRSTGLVVGLLEPDGHTRIVAWGDPGPGQPPLDGRSVFEIGSLSKVFTATVLADMVLKGEVSLDDPVQRFLPTGVTMPTRHGKEITLGTLSEQNSGLPRLPTNMAPADMSNPEPTLTGCTETVRFPVQLPTAA